MKTCNDCKVEKPLDEFPKSRQTKSGYLAYCRKCWSARSMKWQRANADRYREYRSAWGKANRDKLNTYKRNWISKNREKWNAYMRDWYQRKKALA